MYHLLLWFFVFEVTISAAGPIVVWRVLFAIAVVILWNRWWLRFPVGITQRYVVTLLLLSDVG